MANMATRFAILLLVLLVAVLSFQAIVADEAVVVDAVSAADSSVMTSLETQTGTQTSEVAGIDTEDLVDGKEEEDDSLSPAHPLARILTQRSSKRCWSKKNCKKFFKKPGCCKNKCVNLHTDNKNCGKCGRSCKTKKGYCCVKGKCNKPKKPSKPSSPGCGRNKKCKRGYTCCKGKCVNLKNNKGHCGKCNKGCGYGSDCCHGKCKSLKHDNSNCGKCGRSCGYGRKCCHGYCKNIFGSDNHHCGACGKKCATKCKFGMCGYGL